MKRKPLKEYEILNHIAEIAQFSDYKKDIMEYVRRKQYYIKTKRDWALKNTDKRASAAFERLSPYIEEEDWRTSQQIYEDYAEDASNEPYNPNELNKDLNLLVTLGFLEKRKDYLDDISRTIYLYKLKM